jgi:hypothetical protein
MEAALAPRSAGGRLLHAVVAGLILVGVASLVLLNPELALFGLAGVGLAALVHSLSGLAKSLGRRRRQDAAAQARGDGTPWRHAIVALVGAAVLATSVTVVTLWRPTDDAFVRFPDSGIIPLADAFFAVEPQTTFRVEYAADVVYEKDAFQVEEELTLPPDISLLFTETTREALRKNRWEFTEAGLRRERTVDAPVRRWPVTTTLELSIPELRFKSTSYIFVIAPKPGSTVMLTTPVRMVRSVDPPSGDASRVPSGERRRIVLERFRTDRIEVEARSALVRKRFVACCSMFR